LTVYSQDDPAFPATVSSVVDDSALELSWNLDLTTVPTLVKVDGGKEVGRLEGWHRDQWEEFTAVDNLGPGLPTYRPGCGSRTLDPGVADELAVRFKGGSLVVPPTEARVLRMLEGTTKSPDEIVAVVPPDLVACTVEKVAINAVMAGCRPEYLPVVLAAVEAACTDEFNAHGLLATTWFSGPMVVVNGPIAKAIGMNSGVNALGQGNRANATIGRALQLVIRNVGGGRPGGVDRATLGNPGKYTFCFAEDEDGSPWEPLSVERGWAAGTSTVTLAAAAGVQGVADQLSRTPESLARTLAACLRASTSPKSVMAFDAILVISPEHGRVFREAGWSKARLRKELDELLTIDGSELVRGAGGIDDGLPRDFAGSALPKFRPGGLLIVHAGGHAGLFSAVIAGWVGGAMGSQPITKEVVP
jgi:hypothetical protein